MEAAPFEDNGAAKVFDEGPLTADRGPGAVGRAAAAFLEVAAPHDDHAAFFDHDGSWAAEKEAIYLCIPEVKEAGEEPFGLRNKDELAAVAPAFACSLLAIWGADDLPSEPL